MGDTILLPVGNFQPWTRTVATVLKEIESKGVTVVLLYIFEDQEVTSTRVDTGSDASKKTDALAARKSGLNTVREELKAGNLEVEVRGMKREGERGDDILSFVEKEGIDRIYTYGRKRSPVGKAVFGSSLQRMLSNSPVPVVVIPSNVDR